MAGFRPGGRCILWAQTCAPALALCLGAAAVLLQPAQAATKLQDAPDFVAPEAGRPPAGTRVDVFADRLTYDSKAKIATATGTVRITYGPYVLTATRVVYDMNRNQFKANGSVVLQEPNGNVLEADMAQVNDKFKEGFAEHVRALLNNDVTITARYARRFENGITVYENASYTACKTCVDEGGTPVWQIVSRETTHDQQKQMLYYRDATFEIAGVPVAYTPYFAYPDPTVKRRTGFLIPGFHYGSVYGFGVSTPFFWALAPNADLTITPRFTTDQGVLGDVEWRQRLANGEYNVRGLGIYELDPDKTKNVDSRWRGALESAGEFAINDTWKWGWDGTAVSDREFLDDYEIDSANMITSQIYAIGLDDRNYTAVQAAHYRTMLQDENQDQLPFVAPYVTGNYIFDQTVLGGELGLDFSAYYVNRDEAVCTLPGDADPTDTSCNDYVPGYDVLGTDQTRAVADIHWQRQFINSMGALITPFAHLRSDFYVSNDVPTASAAEETTARVLPTAGIDIRWPLVSSNGFGQSVLTPVAQVITSSNDVDAEDISTEDAITLNFDQTNLFLMDRFSGYDRYEGGTRVNVGVLYNLLADNGGFLRASLGESFHIAGENSFVNGSGLNGTSSNLVAGLAYQPNDFMRFSYQARVEQDLSKINVQEGAISLTFDRISGSLAYADVAAAPAYGRDSDEQQVWGDAVYRLTGAWNLFGAFRYDLEEDDFMEKLIGIGYDCDCMNVQLTYSESKDEDQGIDRVVKLSVELRTIGQIDGGFKF
ncbi:MAG: LPS assembly protein LptD [Hyphomicrobiales bacterium]